MNKITFEHLIFMKQFILNIRRKKDLFPPRIELGTFCVLGRRDNRYTTET